MINNSLPVEKLDGEFSLYFQDNLIKDDNDILTEKTLCDVLLNLSENKNTINYEHSELFDVATHPFDKLPDLPVTFHNIVSRKHGKFTTKQQQNKKSKKSARRNNRRAKRNNR